MLDDDRCRIVQPAAVHERVKRRRREAGTVGRIQQRQIASPERRRQAGRVGGDDRRPVGAAQGLDIGAEHPAHVGFALDGGEVCRPAGECFQAEGAGAGEQIDDQGTFQGRRHAAMDEDVEQGLPRSLSGGSHARACGRAQAPAAQATADDPHVPGAPCRRAARAARAAVFRRSPRAAVRRAGRARRPCGSNGSRRGRDAPE